MAIKKPDKSGFFSVTSFLVTLYGRGIRIRTLNNGVRVRCVTVTLYLYIMICTINAFTIITYKNNLSSFILKF